MTEPWQWIALIGGILLGCLLYALFVIIIIAISLFMALLKRTKKTKWTRECSVNEPVQQTIYGEGLAWESEVTKYKKDLHMVNEGLNLYAEYFDLGNKKAVIIVPGRTEGLRYGYFFARPYAESGYNVMTIDQRAHGLSDGTYNTLGFDEHRDLLAWAKILHDEYGMEQVIFHGICIGSACSLYALLAESSPEYLGGMVAEGMFPNFYESFANHIREKKQPTFPAMFFINSLMKHYTGYDMKVGPIDMIDKLTKPILFLHSREDAYSRPDKAELLYEKCGSPDKKIVWYEHGRHSQLRYVDSQKYDNAIKAFLAEKVSAKEPVTE